jgi:hypothetical protein
LETIKIQIREKIQLHDHLLISFDCSSLN